MHEEYGYGVRNESGERLFEFACAHELVITNSNIRNKSKHLIKYQSGGCAIQFDYVLFCKRVRAMCMDCKVVQGVKLDSFYLLIVLVIRMQKRVVERRRSLRKYILWVNLRDEVHTTFTMRISSMGFVR